METSLDRIDKFVGSRIRRRRNLLGIDETTLAQRIGVKTDDLQIYESGAARVSAGDLRKIAEVLLVPPTFFFDGLTN